MIQVCGYPCILGMFQRGYLWHIIPLSRHSHRTLRYKVALPLFLDSPRLPPLQQRYNGAGLAYTLLWTQMDLPNTPISSSLYTHSPPRPYEFVMRNSLRSVETEGGSRKANRYWRRQFFFLFWAVKQNFQECKCQRYMSGTV